MLFISHGTVASVAKPDRADRQWWNRENRVTLLERYWDEGLSASIIGNILGTTRNAVIGKAHRMRLAARQLSARAPYVRKEKVTPVKTPKKKSWEPTAPEPIPEPVRITPKDPVEFMELKWYHCRWPLTVSKSSGMMLSCGAPKIDGSPYCEEHTRMARSSSKMQR